MRTAEVLAAAGSGGGPAGGVPGARGADHRGVRVHAIRLPGLLAHQETLFGGLGEVLTIRHDATSRACYVAGVLLGVRAMAKGDRVGLVDGLEAVLFP
jgi:4-hydroxy-tetrahydrodipicolinate reductase